VSLPCKRDNQSICTLDLGGANPAGQSEDQLTEALFFLFHTRKILIITLLEFQSIINQ
jgi:hypothetical protein